MCPRIIESVVFPFLPRHPYGGSASAQRLPSPTAVSIPVFNKCSLNVKLKPVLANPWIKMTLRFRCKFPFLIGCSHLTAYMYKDYLQTVPADAQLVHITTVSWHARCIPNNSIATTFVMNFQQATVQLIGEHGFRYAGPSAWRPYRQSYIPSWTVYHQFFEASS